MEDLVDIHFAKPRKRKSVKKSHYLHADGEPELHLPMVWTTLFTVATPEGVRVEGVRIPRWIAEDRGLLDRPESPPVKQDETTTMSRDDWFQLGAFVGLIIRGETVSDAMWESLKVPGQLKERQR